MLYPSDLSRIAEPVVDIFAQAEAEILGDIARRIVKMGEVTNTAGWQTQKLKESGLVNYNAIKRLAEATGSADEEIQTAFRNSYQRALRYDIDVVPADKIVKFKDVSNNPIFRSIMLQGVNNSRELISNFSNSTARATQLAYFNSVDVAYIEAISGAFTRNEAVKIAVNKLAKSGIFKVAYGEEGNGIYHSIENAVRRAIVTAINQSCAKLQLANCNEMDTDLVEVSAHMGARPSHREWQGQVYSVSGKHPKYPPFSRTGYGTGDGLCGWNCRHTFYPFFEGYSKRAYSDKYLNSVNEQESYETEQKQRMYERQVRYAKREVYVLSEALKNAQSQELAKSLEADLSKAKTKLTNRQTKLREYCNDNGLFLDYSRTYTAGYNGKKSSKLSSNVVDNYKNSGIINTGGISGALNPYSKQAVEHAERYYESVRHIRTDTYNISKNTGYSKDKIDKIKNHIFIDKHTLLNGYQRFDPSYDMAQSWQRLIDGKYMEKDIVLLKHEYAELRCMEKGYSQAYAHIRASKRYNYAKYCD